MDEDYPLIELTAADRCDGCGARACTLAKHEDFGELLFCLHHRNKNEQSLLDEGWTLIDDYQVFEMLTGNNKYAAPV